MKYDEIMVRYGELSTKGRNKKTFTDRLGENVRRALHGIGQVKVHARPDRLHIILNGADSDLVMERLSKVFGIQSFSPSLKVTKDFAAVAQAAIAMMNEQLSDGEKKTFKVETKRQDHQFELDTFQMNRQLGGSLLKAFDGQLTVDVYHPDITIWVDVRLNGIFLTSEIIPGAGGLPVGTAGKGMMMLSGGIDRKSVV